MRGGHMYRPGTPPVRSHLVLLVAVPNDAHIAPGVTFALSPDVAPDAGVTFLESSLNLGRYLATLDTVANLQASTVPTSATLRFPCTRRIGRSGHRARPPPRQPSTLFAADRCRGGRVGALSGPVDAVPVPNGVFASPFGGPDVGLRHTSRRASPTNGLSLPTRRGIRPSRRTSTASRFRPARRPKTRGRTNMPPISRERPSLPRRFRRSIVARRWAIARRLDGILARRNDQAPIPPSAAERHIHAGRRISFAHEPPPSAGRRQPAGRVDERRARDGSARRGELAHRRVSSGGDLPASRNVSVRAEPGNRSEGQRRWVDSESRFGRRRLRSHWHLRACAHAGGVANRCRRSRRGDSGRGTLVCRFPSRRRDSSTSPMRLHNRTSKAPLRRTQSCCRAVRIGSRSARSTRLRRPGTRDELPTR